MEEGELMIGGVISGALGFIGLLLVILVFAFVVWAFRQ
jgi:hypothetical protein